MRTIRRWVTSTFVRYYPRKRTVLDATLMSALHPIADMCSALAHVCFVPIADIHWVVSRRPLSAIVATGQVVRREAEQSLFR
jgi:hypothetical protein